MGCRAGGLHLDVTKVSAAHGADDEVVAQAGE